MLRFMPGVSVNYFNRRIGDVLELASVWSALRHITVDVNALGDKEHGDNSLHPWGLALDLDTDGDKMEHLEQLNGFLARYLPGEYDVVLEKDHVHVEWDMDRKPVKVAAPDVAAKALPV